MSIDTAQTQRNWKRQLLGGIRLIGTGLTAIIAAISLQSPTPARAALVTVNTLTDVVDPVDGLCSLREAIIATDTNAASGAAAGECVAGTPAPGIDQIAFSVTGTISVSSILGPLPALTDGYLLVNGWSAPGWFRFSPPLITLDGAAFTGIEDGLTSMGHKNHIRGLTVVNFPGAGIVITGDTGSNWIYGNSIGMDPVGAIAMSNGNGIELWGSAQFNLIGTNGDGVSDRLESNVISGNIGAGILIAGWYSVNQTTIAGNAIGTNWSGTTAFPNWIGIDVASGATNTVIGTNSSGNGFDWHERNVISGNTYAGVQVSNASATVIAGNYVGLNGSGSAAIPNDFGILSSPSALNTLIGTDADGVADSDERNVISGNAAFGLHLSGVDETVAGNYVGLDDTGAIVIANQDGGIVAAEYGDGSGGPVTIGGGTSVHRNVVAGNGQMGMSIGVSDSLVQCNWVGTDAAGIASLPNGVQGIFVSVDGDGLVIQDNLVIDHNVGVQTFQPNITMVNNTISGNVTGLQLSVDNVSMLAENNWWGDVSGPTDPGNPAGIGDPILVGIGSVVDYTPWLGAVPVVCP